VIPISRLAIADIPSFWRAVAFPAERDKQEVQEATPFREEGYVGDCATGGYRNELALHRKVGLRSWKRAGD